MGLRKFKGYSLITALARNKDNIKVILTILAGFAAYMNIDQSFDWKSFLIALGVAMGALVSKVLFDAFDYFFTEVPDEPPR